MAPKRWVLVAPPGKIRELLPVRADRYVSCIVHHPLLALRMLVDGHVDGVLVASFGQLAGLVEKIGTLPSAPDLPAGDPGS